MKSVLPSDTDNNINYSWAFSLIHQFSLQGVTQAVISPGSRSTPLALACVQHPEIKHWLHIDERCAAFFALGLAQYEHQSVILICTSGSAVANWFPAVVEANYSYTPLLLLSADRPAELHNCGTNQTIDQQFLFGSHVRDFINLNHANKKQLHSHYIEHIAQQAYQQSINNKPGPVHINIPFREPLLPQCKHADELNQTIKNITDSLLEQENCQRDTPLPSPDNSQKLINLINTINQGQGLIICGGLNHYEQQDMMKVLPLLADKLNCPVLLEPLSNQRLCTVDHSNYIINYSHFLAYLCNPGNQHYSAEELKKLTPRWILRFGQFPVSKHLSVYLDSLQSDFILVSSFGDALDPLHKAHQFIFSSPAELCYQILKAEITPASEQWLKLWQHYEQQSEHKIHQEMHSLATQNKAPYHFFEGHVINQLLQCIPDNSLIFSGNSMAIRDFDTFITHTNQHGKQLDFFANRGCSGIDGNISTFLGLLAKAEQHYGVALLGDLSFYHDMNALLIAKQLSQQNFNATIIIINNNGGGIFNYLPQKQLTDFEQLWQTPIHLNFDHAAKLYGLNYDKIEGQHSDALTRLNSKLEELFKQPGIQLLEIIINQEISVKCHDQINY